MIPMYEGSYHRNDLILRDDLIFCDDFLRCGTKEAIPKESWHRLAARSSVMDYLLQS